MIGIGVLLGNNQPSVMSRVAARGGAFSGSAGALAIVLVCRMEARLRPVIHESLQEAVVWIGRRDVRYYFPAKFIEVDFRRTVGQILELRMCEFQFVKYDDVCL
jgi:hypothetical protein